MTYIKIAGAVLAIVVIGLIGFFVYRSTQFYLVDTSPDTNDPIPATLSSFDVNFSQELAEDTNPKITSDNNIVEDFDVTGNTLVLFISSLEPDRRYKITIDNLRSAGGDELENVELGLQTADIPFSEWNEDMVEQELEAQDREDPNIREILPYSAEYYEISYDVGTAQSGDEVIIVRIDMKFTEGRSGSGSRNAYLDAVRQYRQEALDYIKNQGFNLDDYTISYGEDVLIDEFPGEFNVQTEEEYTGDGIPPEERDF